jgi:iron complex outermembrane recepter protein
MKFGWYCAVAPMALLAGAQTLQAQETASPVEENTQALVDIVVTAQRRSENLQKVAVPVSALNSEALANANVSQAQDLSKLVPALKLSTSGGGGTQVIIRGVGNFVGNPYAEPAVAVNLDSVYLARSSGTGGLFFDLDRVEVLKGPQGTLYGRNATAGALNIITRKPVDKLEASGSLEAGNFDKRRADLALNAPLGGGSAIRIAGQITRRDGYFTDGYNDDRSEAVRAQIKLVASDRLNILLSSDYEHIGGKGSANVFAPFLTSNPYAGPNNDGSNGLLTGVSLGITSGGNPDLLPKFKRDGFVDNTNYGFSATIDYDLGDASLTVIPAYRNSEADYLHYTAGFPVSAHEASGATSLEARLASTDNGAFKWLIGGYLFNENQNFQLKANQGVASADTRPVLKTRSRALFGQVTYSLTDAVRLTGGLRYTHEHKTQAGTNNLVPLQGELNAERLTWKAGVEFDAAAQSLLYANVGTGFKAGGFFGSLPPNTYKPEMLTAYTIGAKNRFFGNTLQLNGEAFYWRYNDKQVTHLGPILPGGFDLITENAGKAEIYGLEIEGIMKPVRGGTLSANLQYLHSNYKSFTYTQTTITGPAQTACPITPAGLTAVTVNCSGRPLPLSPKWTVNLSYRQEFELGGGSRINAQVGTRIESSYWTGEEYLAGELQNGVMVSNASLGWTAPDGHFSLSAYVDNIEDKAVKAASFVQPVVGLPMVALRPPRTYGVRLGLDF